MTLQLHLATADALSRLRRLLGRLPEEYPSYRRSFAEVGVESTMDPLMILSMVAPVYGCNLAQLADDVLLRLRAQYFLNEHTSGTTGRRKLRLTSRRDETAEELLTCRFFTQCGLGPGDRVVALDIDSADIYLFYARALERLAVRDFVFHSVGHDFDRSLDGVFVSDPTTLITVPSVLSRSWERFKALLEAGEGPSLRRVIYIGEAMSLQLRTALERRGLEVFSFYGTTETGCVAGECTCHQGLHVFEDAFIATILNPVTHNGRTSGEVAWTTLHLQDQPLLKYAPADHVTIDREPCVCGLHSPRIVGLRRTQEELVLYGQKFQYGVFRQAVEQAVEHLEFLQVRVTRTARCPRITFYLPDRLQPREARLRATILATDELDYYVHSGFLDVRLTFVGHHERTTRKLLHVMQ